MTRYLGVDPDTRGAWAVVDEGGNLLAVTDAPEVRVGARRRLDEVEVVDAMRLEMTTHATHPLALAVLEATPALPAKMGGLFANHARGACGAVWRTALYAAKVPQREVLATTWKRAAGLLHRNHAELCQAARRRWPDQGHLFVHHTRDHGRAAAAFLALHARRLCLGAPAKLTRRKS